MKKFFALFFLSFLSIQLYGQKLDFEPPLLYEYYYSPSDSIQGVFQLTFQINYENLSFIKNEDVYSSKIRVTLELRDSSSGNILRSNQNKEISVSTFEETQRKNKSCQGLLTLNLSKNKYYTTITLTDLQVNKEIAIPGFSIDLSTLQPKAFVVLSGGSGNYYLANKRRTIPFSPEIYSYVYYPGGLPGVSASNQNDSLCLKFQSQTDSFVFCSTVNSTNSFLLEEDSLGVFLSPSINSPQKYFLFKDISLKLPEGKFKILENEKVRSSLEVKWWDKPHSLLNYEISLKALSLIEPKYVIDSLRELSGNFGYKYFYRYWQKYDPTPGTVYNELMVEFYSRADYAQKTFANFSTPDGILSDRGRVFIQFGQPSGMERTTSVNGKNMEIWFYKERNKTYYFVDNAGNGGYQLVKDK
ncbi:MAG: hypothetical protein AUJ54_14670 [Ignavibacteria bacterium CG1_02_37_35]|nr:GWxTD domain-containing protein [Ignavibacteria bacterium]OIO14156.1 MAG: hypothetical protein AUJ54_14670 [Ignavibacteria bacterium CG1_02_37_35]PIX94314.1 MAG: hypothetical protein COZ25_06210 [Ignavibacteria bacterium CG_4_10_14_3_um_filter_37_18]